MGRGRVTWQQLKPAGRSHHEKQAGGRMLLSGDRKNKIIYLPPKNTFVTILVLTSRKILGQAAKVIHPFLPSRLSS